MNAASRLTRAALQSDHLTAPDQLAWKRAAEARGPLAAHDNGRGEIVVWCGFWQAWRGVGKVGDEAKSEGMVLR